MKKRLNINKDRWWPVIRFFVPYMRKQRVLIWSSFGALLMTSAIRLAEPWPLAFAIDMILSEMTDLNIPDHINENTWSIQTWLAICAGSVVLIAAFKALVGYLSTVGLAKAGSQVLSEVRRDLFSHLLQLSLTFHRNIKSGDLTMRLMNDIGVLREVTVTAIMPLLSSIVIFFGMFSVMFYLDWDLTLIALVLMPFLLWLTRKSGKKIRNVSRQQRKREGALSATAAEFMGGIATVQALSLEDAARQSFSGDDAKSMTQNVRSKRLAAGLERRVELLIAFTTALVLLLGSRDVLNGAMTPGELMIFMSYLKNAFRPVREYAKYTGRLSKAIVAGERVVDLMSRNPMIVDRPGAVALDRLIEDICFKDVRFAYQDSDGAKEILKGIDLHIRAGEMVAITGPSGSGKSTMGSLLLRLYEPTSGEILINGQDLRDYSLKTIRDRIGFVPQDNLLFGTSVRDNITIAAHCEVSDDEMIAAAKLANAHDFIMALPDGYDTVIAERGASLSGGQRQRISIARAAVRKSPILILDEPGTGLDGINEQAVLDALMRLMAGRTSVVITHNLPFAMRADRIIFLAGGKVLEQGTHDELLALNGRYAEMWFSGNNHDGAGAVSSSSGILQTGERG